MNIVFDLDGTLIDSKRRLYTLFQSLAPDSILSYEQYWELKQDGHSNERILETVLGYEASAIETFVSSWMSRIETPEMLALDQNFFGVPEFLSGLSMRYQLHICTARQKRLPLLEQLERLGLLPLFASVLITEQKYSKESLIKARLPTVAREDWLVGDTGKDITIGKSLDMKTCAVLSGSMSRQRLLDYQPDRIIDSVLDFTPF